MEKNWIEKIREFIHKAMNKGLYIKGYKDKLSNNEDYYEITVDKIIIRIGDNRLNLHTPKGRYKGNINLNKRDLLELDAIILSIEEYNEDMALMEFNNFFGEEENKIVKMEDLDNDDE